MYSMQVSRFYYCFRSFFFFSHPLIVIYFSCLTHYLIIILLLPHRLNLWDVLDFSFTAFYTSWFSSIMEGDTSLKCQTLLFFQLVDSYELHRCRKIKCMVSELLKEQPKRQSLFKQGWCNYSNFTTKISSACLRKLSVVMRREVTTAWSSHREREGAHTYKRTHRHNGVHGAHHNSYTHHHKFFLFSIQRNAWLATLDIKHPQWYTHTNLC